MKSAILPDLSSVFRQPASRQGRGCKLRLGRFLSGSIAAILAVQSAQAASATWTGTNSPVWATAANWSASPAPGTGDDATFNGPGAGNTTIDLGAGVTVNAVVFDSVAAGAYTIGSGAVNSQTLTLNNAGSVVINGGVSASQLFNSALTLGTDGTSQTFTIGNFSSIAGLTFAGGITGSTGVGVKTLAVKGAGNTAISGSIANGATGTLALAKSGTGTLTLSGASSYTGATTVSAGTLQLSGANGAISASAGITLNGGNLALVNTSGQAGVNRLGNSATITSNGGSLTYTNTAASTDSYAETVGSLSLVSGQLNVVLANNQNAGGSNSQTLTLSGLSRSGSTNASVVTFGAGGGLNTMTNMIVVSGAGTTAPTAGGGAGIIGPWATVGSAAGIQTDYAAYNADRVVGANIAGSVQSTWIQATENFTSTSTDNVVTGTRSMNSWRYSAAAGSLTLGKRVFNTNGILNGGTGLLTISGTTGVVRLPANGGGRLYVTTGSADISLGVRVVNRKGALTLVKSGTHTLSVSGNNAYTGGTTLNAGVLQANSALALGSIGNITFAGGSLQYTGFSAGQDWGARIKNSASAMNLDTNLRNIALAGVVAGSNTGGIAKSGLGRLVLSGANSFSGGVTVNGGTLSIASDGTGAANQLGAYPGSVQPANITLNEGSTLEVSAATTLAVNRGITLGSGLSALSRPGTFDFIVNSVIAGPGGLILQDNVPGVQNGGQIQLNAANSYTGITTMAYANRGNGIGTQSIIGNVDALRNSTVDYLNILGQPRKSGGTGDRIIFGTGPGSTPVIGGLKGNDLWYLSDASLVSAINVQIGSNNQNTIYAGVLDDNTRGSSVTKIGLGTLTLGGVNVYKGGTTVSAGTLIVTRNGSALGLPKVSGNNGLTVNTGAAFAYLPTAAGALTLSGSTNGTLTFQPGSTIGTAVGGTAGQSAITSSVAATAAGSITINVSGIPGVTVPAGTTSNNLITALSGLTSGGATYTLGKIYNATNFTVGALTPSDTAISLSVTQGTALTAATWKGGFGGGNNVWALGNGLGGAGVSNWTTNGSTATGFTPGSGADVTFTSANSPVNQTAMVLGANMAIKSLTVSDTGGITLNEDGNALTIAGTTGISISGGAGPVTLRAPINLGAGQTWLNNSANTLTIGGDVANGANLLTVDGSGNTVISGSIRNGTGGLTKSGAGILTLNGMNLYQGTTTVNAGTLRAGNRFAFGGAMYDGFANGGVGGVGFASIAFGAGSTGTVQLNGNNTTLMTLATNATVGTPVLENASSVPVTLTVAAASNSSISNGTALVNTYAGVLRDGAGGGSLGLQVTVGTLTLAGANTYTGNTTFSGGAIVAGAAETAGVAGPFGNPASPAGSMVFNGGALRYSSANAFDYSSRMVATGNNPYIIDTNGQAVAFASALGAAGTSGLTKAGAGTLTLSAASSYTGVTTINEGTLSVATLANGGSNSGIGASSSAATNLVIGTATLRYTGPTVTSDRSLAIPGGSTASFEVTQAATVLRLAGATGAATNGSLTKTGSGTLGLTGVNTYTGTTTVQNGTLLLDMTGSGTIASSSALNLGGGTFRVLGKTSGATAQTMGSLTLLAGSSSTIALDPNNSGAGSTTLTLGNNWTRGIGATLLIDYSSTNTGTRQVVTAGPTTTYTLSNGIYGGILVKDSAGVTGFATRAAGASQPITLFDDTTGTTLEATSNAATVNFTTLNTAYGAGLLTWTNGGALTARSVNSLTIDTTNNGGTIDMGASTNVLTLGSGAILFKGSKHLTLTGGQVGVAGSEVIVHQNGPGRLTVNSLVSSGSGALTKGGTGSMTIGATSTYSGATTINAGTLNVTGSIVSSAVTVNKGGTLAGGSGGSTTVGRTGAMVVKNGGAISPGDALSGTTATGILSPGNGAGAALTMDSGSTLTMTLKRAVAPGADFDQIRVVGAVSLGSAALSLNGPMGVVFGNTLVGLISNDGGDAITGGFAGLAQGGILANLFGNSQNYLISYTGIVDGTGKATAFTGGNDVVLQAGGWQTDLFLQNTVTGERQLWRMSGAIHSTTEDIGVVTIDWQIAGIGDFNGDGKLDLVWQNTTTGERSIWFMNGAVQTGTASLGTVATSLQIAGVEDFNSDGKPDIVWQNTATGEVTVWYMDGATQTGTASIGVVATTMQIGGIGDFNGDQKPDLVWRDTATNARSVWYMNGVTQTGTAALPALSSLWRNAGTGDFNSDGKPDLILENTSTGARTIWLMNGVTRTDVKSVEILATDWQICN